MKWWVYVIIGGCIFTVGVVVGYSSHHPGPATVNIIYPDAGTVAQAVASVGPVSCDAGVVVKIVPGKPRTIYLPGDAGQIDCPVCPEVEVVATSGALAGPVSTLATASAPPPVIVKEVEYRDTHRTWGVGPAFTKPYDVTGVGYGATVQYQPLNWPEISATFTSKEVMVSPTVRF